MSIFSTHTVDEQPGDVRILVAREADLSDSRNALFFDREIYAAGEESTHVILDLSAISNLGADSVMPLEALSEKLANECKKVAIVGLPIGNFAIIKGFELHHGFIWAHNYQEALDGLTKEIPRIVSYPVALIDEQESAVIVTTCLPKMNLEYHFALFEQLIFEVIGLGKHIVIDYSATEWVNSFRGLLNTVSLLNSKGKKMAICGVSDAYKQHIHNVKATAAFVWATNPEDALAQLVA